MVLFIFIAAKVFLPFPAAYIDEGLSAGWIMVIISLCGGLAGFLVIAALIRLFPDSTIVEAAERILGPVGGLAAGVVFFGFFITITSLTLRQFGEAMISAALPLTPISAIELVFMAAMFLACYLGIEVIGRSALLAAPYLTTAGALTVFLLYSFWNYHNFFPVWGAGIEQITKMGLLRSSAFGEILLVAYLAPVLGGAGRCLRAGFYSVLLAGLSILLLVAGMELAFSPETGRELNLPFYNMSRLVYLGRFFQRTEAVFVLFWSVAGMIMLAAGFYAATFSIANALRLPDYRPLLWPVGLMIFTLSLLPPDLPTATYLDTMILRMFGWIPAFALPALLLLIAVLRRAGGKGGKEGG